MFTCAVEGDSGIQHTHGGISLWRRRTPHRLTCTEKKGKFVRGLGVKEVVWGLRRSWVRRGRLINWRNRRRPGTHRLDKDEGQVLGRGVQGKKPQSKS